jgi:hypothetical protein
MNKMSRPSHSSRFKCNTLSLYDIIRDVVSDKSDIEPLILDAAELIIETRSEHKMVDDFLKYTYKHWDQIENKEVKYFSEFALSALERANSKGQKSFVGAVDISHIEKIRHIIEDPDCVDEETRQSVFKIMFGLVKISIQYCHEKRKTNPAYMSHVDLPASIERWKVKGLN